MQISVLYISQQNKRQKEEATKRKWEGTENTIT